MTRWNAPGWCRLTQKHVNLIHELIDLRNVELEYDAKVPEHDALVLQRELDDLSKKIGGREE